MRISDVRVRWAAIGAAVAVTLGAGGLVGVGASSSTADATLVPVSPVRILDTRAGDPVGNLTDGASITVQVTGAIPTVGQGTKQVVPAGAAAITGNLTMVGTQANEYGGFATMYPCDAAKPDASNLNFVSGETVANSVAVPLSADGTVCVFVYGVADVLLDVSGYYSTDRLAELTADPLAGVDCPETASLVRTDGEWACTPTPGYELIEDANGRRFTLVNGVGEFEGARYDFSYPDGFVRGFRISSPGDWSAPAYHRSADCSGPSFVRTDTSYAVLHPDSVFEGRTFISGIWGDEVWARVGVELGSTVLQYWRLDESSTMADSEIRSVRQKDDDNNDVCNTSPGQQDWLGAVAYEVVWLGPAVTEQFEPPFTRVFGAAEANLCVGELGARVSETVC